MDAVDPGRIALRVVIALVSVLDGIDPCATARVTEMLTLQYASAEDEGERAELSIAVRMLEQITAGPAK